MDDELWAVIEPLLPTKLAGTPGPPQMDSRRVLRGILFVLITGIGWEDLPQELGFGSGMTCRRRLRDWQAAGAFEQIHQGVLARAHAARLIDFDRIMVDGSHVRARRDIPGPGLSSSSGRVAGVWRPGGGFVVGGAGLEAAVEDAHEPVGELA
ncbi:transposase [Nocardia sp. NPDC059091]|uniref:transposase n=1 Tax=unclassified Nocardia TaxID=2637762 RepID=UPI0036900EF8